MNSLGSVKKFREDNELTQKELAELCGVTLRTVQNWEAGKSIPDNIIRLLTSLTERGEIISCLTHAKNVGGNLNSPIKQHVRGDGNHFSGTGNVTDGVPATMLHQALNEITEMRSLLAESVRNVNDLSQRIMSMLENTNK